MTSCTWSVDPIWKKHRLLSRVSPVYTSTTKIETRGPRFQIYLYQDTMLAQPLSVLIHVLKFRVPCYFICILSLQSELGWVGVGVLQTIIPPQTNSGRYLGNLLPACSFVRFCPFVRTSHVLLANRWARFYNFQGWFGTSCHMFIRINSGFPSSKHWFCNYKIWESHLLSVPICMMPYYLLF